MLPSSCIRTKLLLSVVACFLQSCVLLMWRGSVGGVIWSLLGHCRHKWTVGNITLIVTLYCVY